MTGKPKSIPMAVAKMMLNSLVETIKALTSGLGDVNESLTLLREEVEVNNEWLRRVYKLLDEQTDELAHQTDQIVATRKVLKKIPIGEEQDA